MKIGAIVLPCIVVALAVPRAILGTHALGWARASNPDDFRDKMSALREEKTFTDAEFVAAFSFVLTTDKATRAAKGLNRLPDMQGFASASPEELRKSPVKSERSYDGDILDLLSLVSEDCAERAWKLLGITAVDGKQRRRKFFERMRPVLLRRPTVALGP